MKHLAWDEYASTYIENIDIGSPDHQSALDTVMRLVSSLPGQKILDVGCGEGRISRLLIAQRTEVLGTDLSAEMVKAAQYKSSGFTGLSFQQEDAQALHGLQDSSFDGAVCCLSLNNVPDLSAACNALGRVLRPRSWVVALVPHPAFEAPGSVMKPATPDLPATRHIPDGYLGEGFYKTSDKGSVRGVVGNFHHTISSYLNSFVAQGFTCTALLEPKSVGVRPEMTPIFLAYQFHRGA